MMYRVVIEKKVERQLERIPSPYFEQLVKALKGLAENPRPLGCKKLKGRTGYRIRIGNYRILYTIHDNILTILVFAVGHRKDIYD